MTVAEAALILEVKPGLVYDLCAAGLLAHRRVGLGRGLIRIDRADLDAYLASSRVERRGPSPVAPAPRAASPGNPLDRARAERERRRLARAAKKLGENRK